MSWSLMVCQANALCQSKGHIYCCLCRVPDSASICCTCVQLLLLCTAAWICLPSVQKDKDDSLTDVWDEIDNKHRHDMCGDEVPQRE